MTNATFKKPFASREYRTLPDQVRQLVDLFAGNPPVKLSDLAKSLGLIVRAAELPRGISGEIRPSDESESGFMIRVNKHESKVRQRFTVAHEIAHYLLHCDRIGDGVRDDFLYRSALSDRIEAEANRLAADILMPPSVVEKFLDEGSGNDFDEMVKNMAETFNVSEQAMKIRIGAL